MIDHKTLEWQEWLDHVFAEDGPGDPRMRLLLAALAVRLRADHRAPSIAVLAQMTTYSPKVVQKLMTTAWDAGWIAHEELRQVWFTDDRVRRVTSDSLVTLQ